MNYYNVSCNGITQLVKTTDTKEYTHYCCTRPIMGDMLLPSIK